MVPVLLPYSYSTRDMIDIVMVLNPGCTVQSLGKLIKFWLQGHALKKIKGNPYRQSWSKVNAPGQF